MTLPAQGRSEQREQGPADNVDCRVPAHVHKTFDHFVKTYQSEYSKATACLERDRDALLAFHIFPAEYWVHILTTSPFESNFATIRHRPDRTKGCISHSTILLMICKLGIRNVKRWYRIQRFEYLNKIIDGMEPNEGVEANGNTDDSRNATR